MLDIIDCKEMKKLIKGNCSSHVLPTSGTAKCSSPPNVGDFLKKSSLVYYEKEMKEKAHKVITLANYEGLDAHAQSVAMRFNNK